jgi:hypothetical protein
MPKKNPLDAFAVKGKPENDTPFRVNEFPSLAKFVNTWGLKAGVVKFDIALEEWRRDFERNMPRPSVTETTTVQEAVVAAAPVSGGVAVATPSNQEQLDQLSDDFQEHIAADVVHRKDTPVVGESDEQILEAKTIGQLSPRYGRFTHSLQRNTVLIDEILTIPADYNIVVAGPFTVGGELVVDGYFASVDTEPY